MSRGYGRVQRTILEWLATDPEGSPRGFPAWSTIADAATHVYDTGDPTDAQISAVRRAVRALAADGAIETKRGAIHPEEGRGRRNGPPELMAYECRDSRRWRGPCEPCELGFSRYTASWIDEGLAVEYPRWGGDIAAWVDRVVERGAAYHVGVMAPRRFMDSFSATLMRRNLTADEHAAEESAVAALAAALSAAFGQTINVPR